MRVLVLHSRYLSGSVSGENRVVEDEIRLLRNHGHEVVEWTPEPKRDTFLSSPRLGVNTVWSLGASAAVKSLIRTHRPDVMHLHNMFPALSPAVIAMADSEALPVILTLHNYRLMCLPADFR